LRLKSLGKTLLFFLVFLLITPSFKDFLDYYYNFDPTFDAFIEIIVFVSVLVATIIYSEFLEDKGMKLLIRVAIIALMINNIFNILLTMNVTFGMSKFTYVTLQTIFFDSVYQAFLYLPAFVAMAKLIPEHVETSVFALLKSVNSLQVLVYGRLLGTAIFSAANSASVINMREALIICMIVTTVVAFFMLFWASILPSENEIESVQRMIFYEKAQKDRGFDRTKIDLN
jgi:hypothetical protein